MILRRFTSADVDGLARLHGDAEVMRYIGDPEPRAVVESSTLPAILREYVDLPAGMGQFAADAPEFIGWFSLRPATSVGLDPGDVELGYRLLPSCWGRGLATEGARVLVRRAFEELGLPRVVATTMAVNTGSRRVLEKAGLRHVHTFHGDWPDPLPGADEGDVVYALNRREWRDQPEK
ncbi:GNAT family N-acetyltransferase [Actinophytocola algeriensis]|uniref:RimJ/RimL family protein N-acetyltransferase n=1 Tax=Actinophytocola algeriensis TaxID=1768010 RepID=A0A7W7VH53_9PSEU|nr:GNAT family N-acetyltransferase [Actinophytocola algeriensis]MBB4909720.1 RimJ/RimL family protein N-acetyltransferase [Actinophytocola algeriensis]MBE1475710.1 RimJ/RimL family protein N-acetyltransferase [Actinophytocola algeriensis]